MAGKDWLQASEVVSMFPTLVWRLQLKPEVFEPANAAALGLIRRLRGGDLQPARGSAWQSVQDLHEREELATLVPCFTDATRSVLRFLRIGDEEIAVTACWANLYAPGAAHRMHTHPNNFLSGVYYVQTAPGADTINFHDPRPQTAVIRPPVTELTSENTDQVVVRVAPGLLLLFPAFLPHSVDENASGIVRVSLSVNVMFAGFAERVAKPLWGDQR
jgi:uncharacterized protein (TIGR02466 family)